MSVPPLVRELVRRRERIQEAAPVLRDQLESQVGLLGRAAAVELVGALGLTQPAVSKHLRVLRDAGLVDVRVAAQRRIYRVCPEPLRAVDEWLAPYREQWGERLDALERELETMSDEAGTR